MDFWFLVGHEVHWIRIPTLFTTWIPWLSKTFCHNDFMTFHDLSDKFMCSELRLLGRLVLSRNEKDQTGKLVENYSFELLQGKNRIQNDSMTFPEFFKKTTDFHWFPRPGKRDVKFAWLYRLPMTLHFLLPVVAYQTGLSHKLFTWLPL